MLRELGIALIECEQPTHLVQARLLAIAKNYTSEIVRVMVLPTALVVQVGTVAYEVETVVNPTTQLNLAGRVDARSCGSTAGAMAATRTSTSPPRTPATTFTCTPSMRTAEQSQIRTFGTGRRCCVAAAGRG